MYLVPEGRVMFIAAWALVQEALITELQCNHEQIIESFCLVFFCCCCVFFHEIGFIYYGGDREITVVEGIKLDGDYCCGMLRKQSYLLVAVK